MARAASAKYWLFILPLALMSCAPLDSRNPLLPGADPGARSENVEVQTLNRMAHGAMEAGDPLTAINIYRQTLKVEPGNVEAALGLGNILLDRGQAEDAATAFEHVLKTHRDHDLATFGYAKALITLGRAEAAELHLMELVKRNPREHKVTNLYGVALDMLGRHEDAASIYRAGLYYHPDNVGLRNNLGLSLALGGDYKGAIGVLRPLIEGPDANKQTRQNLALAYGLSGDVDKARQVSLVDLDEASIVNNLAYYARLRGLKPGKLRSSGLRPRFGEMDPASPADGAINLVFGLTSSGTDLGVASASVGNWFVNLGEYSNEAEARARWSDLKNTHAGMLSGLTRLGGAGGGKQPLLAGPLANGAGADEICRTLRSPDQSCRPLKL